MIISAYITLLTFLNFLLILHEIFTIVKSDFVDFKKSLQRFPAKSAAHNRTQNKPITFSVRKAAVDQLRKGTDHIGDHDENRRGRIVIVISG